MEANLTKLIEIVRLAILSVCLVLVAACGENTSNVEIGADTELGIFIPSTTRALTGGTVNAYVTCDSDSPGAERKAMDIDQQGIARAICSGLQPKETSFLLEIEFVLDTDPSNPIPLVNATQSMSLKVGDNPLDFVEGNYSYPDKDSDALSNWKELELGTDPEDATCVIGFSIIGGCTLGGV